MRMRNVVLGVVTLTGLGIYAYKNLLTEEAKEKAKETIRQLQNNWQTVSTSINENLGEKLDTQVLEENRQAIAEAWARIGY